MRAFPGFKPFWSLTRLHHSKIKDNNYVFPPEVELSEEAMDLVSSILTTQPGASRIFALILHSSDPFTPDQRPTLSDILAHSFFLTGPFPASINPSCMSTPPDFRQMSIRSSHRNFRAVKRLCGIEDEPTETPAEAAASRTNAALGVVAEEEEDELDDKVAVPPPAIVAAKATVSDAKGMESEVRQVLQPGSPISELLRCVHLRLIGR